MMLQFVHPNVVNAMSLSKIAIMPRGEVHEMREGQ